MAKTLTDIIIEKVREDQAKKARIALASPQDKDKTEFGYGFASGYFSAMEEVGIIIKNALEAEDSGE